MYPPVEPEERSGTDSAPYLTTDQAKALAKKREAEKKPAKHRKD